MTGFRIDIPDALVASFKEHVSAKLSVDLVDDVAGQVRGGLTDPESGFATEVAHIVDRKICKVIDRTVGYDVGGPVF